MAKTARAAKTVQVPVKDPLTEAIIKGLQEKKAKNIVILDLEALGVAITDKFIVCHGDSSTQLEGLTRSVEETVEKETGENPNHIEGKQNAQWILIDYISVVVHIFQQEQREYYGIERLWADAQIREIND